MIVSKFSVKSDPVFSLWSTKVQTWRSKICLAVGTSQNNGSADAEHPLGPLHLGVNLTLSAAEEKQIQHAALHVFILQNMQQPTANDILI